MWYLYKGRTIKSKHKPKTKSILTVRTTNKTKVSLAFFEFLSVWKAQLAKWTKKTLSKSPLVLPRLNYCVCVFSRPSKPQLLSRGLICCGPKRSTTNKMAVHIYLDQTPSDGGMLHYADMNMSSSWFKRFNQTANETLQIASLYTNLIL